MPPPRSLLLASLLTVLQLALSADAKGGGKGSKGSKKPTKVKKIKHVAFKENGKCYDEQYAVIFPS
jgi:hypothetical protein